MYPIVNSTKRKGYVARNWRWLSCMVFIALLVVTVPYVRTASPSAIATIHEGWYGLAVNITLGVCGLQGLRTDTFSGRTVFSVIFWGTSAWLIWSHFFAS